MPYFAHCPGGTVQRIERIEGFVMTGPDGKESEALGQAFLADIYPGTLAADYVMTHYPVGQPDPYPRGKFAGVGDTWTGSGFVAASDQADYVET